MQVTEHIAALRAEGPLLARAAERAGPDAPVPACPGWRIRDLVRHVGNVHRWATGYVVEQHAAPVGELTEDEMVRSGPAGDKDLPGWFLDGHRRLVSALEQADRRENQHHPPAGARTRHGPRPRRPFGGCCSCSWDGSRRVPFGI